jgi:photosystem II stability/assembly factor-like uncharacterized protein
MGSIALRKLALIFLLFAIFIFNVEAQTSVPPDAIQDLHWRLLGPLRAGWSICVEGLPDEPDIFYFGGADGGVWKTMDSGVRWEPIADHAPFSSVGALAISPGNPRILYVGSGHVDTRYDVMDGTGVYKSEDDGKTWISLGLKDTRHIGRILVDPRNANVVVVAALGHLFGPNSERGVFRSEDGGQNWKKVLYADENTGAVDLASDPGTPDVVYAALWQVRQYPWQSYFTPQSGPGSGIWKSTDGGKTFAQTSRKGLPDQPLSRIGLAVAPQTNGQRIYASVFAEKGAGFYRSDDGGASWQLMNSDGELASTYFARVTADPKNPDVVYVMGRSVHRSSDAGKNFTISKGSPGGDDYHFLWINPKHPERLILASDQGTTVTVNGGKTWSSWYNQATGQFYHLGADNRFPYWVYSGQQDSGTVALSTRSNYGQLTFRDWHPVGADERDYDLPDPDNPDIVYGSGLGGRLSMWYAPTGRVANISPWPVSTYAKRPTTVKYRYTWITPIAVSPRKPHALYHGAQVLFRSLDKGKSWQIISPDLSGADPKSKNCEENVPVDRATACGYGVIFSIAPSPVADGVIWIGTDNGRIQLTRDDGKNWANVTPAAITDWSKIATVDASPTDAATAYVAVDRHRMDDRHPYMYRTHDYGKTWTSIMNGIPEDSWVNVLRQDLKQPGLLYAGTRAGVFVSFDDGAHWQPLQLNMARTGVNDLLPHGNDLIAATQGRSIWVLDDATPLRYLDKLTAAPNLTQPATAIRLSKNENRDTPLPPEIPTTPNPPTGAILDYYLPHDFQNPVVLEILNAKNEVVRTFRTDDKPMRSEAEQYFSDFWLKPLTPLPARPGHTRFVWDLRYPRPKAPKYSYSIAAVPDQDTAVEPQGMLVLPGRYTVRLTIGGKTFTQPLTVELDPRSNAKLADLEAQLDLYRQVSATLAGLTEKLESLKKAQTTAATPTAEKQTEAKKEKDAKLDKLNDAADTLTSLLVDLEGADGPPTVAQRNLYAESQKIIAGR